MTSLCLLHPAQGDYDDRPEWGEQTDALRPLFAARGVEIATERWTSDADLTAHALTIPLMAWGYHRQYDRWLGQLVRWEAAGARMINPLPVLKWNSDKSYLLDFAAKGVTIIPSRLTEALTTNDLVSAREAFGSDTLVIKPASSGGADGTYKLGPGEAVPADVLARKMLIQPMVPTIATEGEFSLFYLGGTFSHAIVKRPAQGDFRVQPQFGGMFEAIDPPAAALALGEAALAASGPDIAYARADMVSDGAGNYLLMEIELIEPYLFLERSPDGGAGFVDMVVGLTGAR